MSFLRNNNIRIYAVEKNMAFTTTELMVYSISIRLNVKKDKEKTTQDRIVEDVRKLDYVFHCEKIN